jgi:hypothetical protein
MGERGPDITAEPPRPAEPLVWERHGDDWRGFDTGRYLLASVVHYDVPVPHWSASVRLERVPGRHETAEQAMAAAERQSADLT